MKKIPVRLLLVLVWLGLFLALLRYEAYPERFTGSLQGYRGLIARELLLRDNWSRILINGRPGGYGHTSIGVDDSLSGKMFDIENRTVLRVSLLGQNLNLSIRTVLRLDALFHLVHFDMRVLSRAQSIYVIGERIDDRDDRFTVSLTMGEHTHRTEVRIPDDTILYAPMMELAMRDLRPGQELTLKTINPLTLDETRIRLQAGETEIIEAFGEIHQARRITATYQGLRLTSWIGRDGLVLRQETPLGWVIEACNPDEALDAVSERIPAPDLLAGDGGAALLRILNFTMGGLSE